MQIQLLGTSGCHLCDMAERLVRRVSISLQIQLSKVDIALDDQLLEQYSLSIPVLRTLSGLQLNWPFDEAQLSEWLQTAND